MTPLRPADIGLWLPAYVQENHDAEREALKHAPHTVAKDAASEAMTLAFNRLEAAEDLALALPAVTLADAAVQVLLAANRVRVMRELDEDGADESRSQAVEWALHAALAVILQAAGMVLDPVTRGHYAPFASVLGVGRRGE